MHRQQKHFKVKHCVYDFKHLCCILVWQVIMAWNFLLTAKIWLRIYLKATVCNYLCTNLDTVLACIIVFQFGKRIHISPGFRRGWILMHLAAAPCWDCCLDPLSSTAMCDDVMRYRCVLRWYLRWAGQVNVLQHPSNEQRRICLERGRPVRGGSSRLSPSGVKLCVWSPRQPEEESERGCAENNPGVPGGRPLEPGCIKANHRVLTETCWTAAAKRKQPQAECNHPLFTCSDSPLWMPLTGPI